MKWIVWLYFILNIFSTYLLTSPLLNESIVPFTASVTNIVTSIVGNGVILLLILVLGIVWLKV